MSGLDSFLIGAGAAHNAYNAERDRREDRRYTASQREHQNALQGVQMESAQLGLEDVKTRRGEAATVRANQQAYGSALADAPDQDTALTNIVEEARKRGDLAAYEKSSTALAGRRASAYKTGVQTALAQFQATGDPTAIAKTFGSLPTGYKANVLKNEDGTYTLQHYGPDARIAGEKQLDAQGLMRAAMMTIDPKIAGDIFKNDLDNEGKRRTEAEKGDQARKTEGVRQTGRVEVAGLESAGRANVAGINARARTGAAGISAGASRYSADQGLAGRKYAADQRTAATTAKGGASNKDVNAGRVALANIFRDPMNSLSATNQQHQLDAQARMEELVLGGMTPLAASKQAFSETGPKNPRNKFNNRMTTITGAPVKRESGLSAATRALLDDDEDADDDD